jgi:cytochrome c553
MRNTIAGVAAAIVLAVIAGVAVVYSGAYYVGADQPHWSVTVWLLNEARIRSIRSHAAGITVPPGLDDRAKILVGVTHFAEHCVVCHGAPGVPPDDIGKGLYPRPPDLAGAARFYTPSELFWIIKHGIKMSGMPAWADHSDEELWATVAFLEELTELSAQDYAKLVAESMAQGGHHHEVHEAQPQPGVAQPPGGLDRNQPAGHQH